MNMHDGIGAMDVIVLLALTFSAAFTFAWAVSPALRNWIERAKYRFQETVRQHDREYLT